MNKIFSVFLLLIIFAFADHVDTGIAKADKAKSNITYHMVHPLQSWKGVSNDVEGTIQYDLKTNQIIHTEIVAPVSSFNSKNTSRDSRMTVLTEASKYYFEQGDVECINCVDSNIYVFMYIIYIFIYIN